MSKKSNRYGLNAETTNRLLLDLISGVGILERFARGANAPFDFLYNLSAALYHLRRAFVFFKDGSSNFPSSSYSDFLKRCFYGVTSENRKKL